MHNSPPNSGANQVGLVNQGAEMDVDDNETDSLEQLGANEDVDADEAPADNIDARTLAHRIVHVSVQLLSNEQLVVGVLRECELIERLFAALHILFAFEDAFNDCDVKNSYLDALGLTSASDTNTISYLVLLVATSYYLLVLQRRRLATRRRKAQRPSLCQVVSRRKVNHHPQVATSSRIA